MTIQISKEMDTGVRWHEIGRQYTDVTSQYKEPGKWFRNRRVQNRYVKETIPQCKTPPYRSSGRQCTGRRCHHTGYH